MRLQGLTFFCTEHQVVTKGTLVFDTFSLAFVFNHRARSFLRPWICFTRGEKTRATQTQCIDELVF